MNIIQNNCKQKQNSAYEVIKGTWKERKQSNCITFRHVNTGGEGEVGHPNLCLIGKSEGRRKI